MSTAKSQSWKYDAGEHRAKHCWGHPEADFVEIGDATVGKCPGTLAKSTAEILLNNGFPYFMSSASYPVKIYNVYNGVVYEAVPTQPGVSFHGYPWRSMPGRKSIPRRILRQLEERAVLNGCLKEYKAWIKNYGT